MTYPGPQPRSEGGLNSNSYLVCSVAFLLAFACEVLHYVALEQLRILLVIFCAFVCARCLQPPTYSPPSIAVPSSDPTLEYRRLLDTLV